MAWEWRIFCCKLCLEGRQRKTDSCAADDSDSESDAESTPEFSCAAPTADKDNDEADAHHSTWTGREWDSLFRFVDRDAAAAANSTVQAGGVAGAAIPGQSLDQQLQFAGVLLGGAYDSFGARMPEQSPPPSLALPIQKSVTLGGDLMTGSLINFATSLPELHAAPGTTAMIREHLSDISVAQIRKAMRDEPFFLKEFFREGQKAHSMKAFRWKEGASVSGSLVRGIRFTMPLPNDMPASLARLVKVPAESRVTVVVRLSGAGCDGRQEDDLEEIDEGEPVILVSQTCTHDAPYGENFRVQETLQFARHPAGGTDLQRWVEVVWVKALPWALGALRPIIESKSVGFSKEAQPALARSLREAVTRSSA